jgi:hypothetical protein
MSMLLAMATAVAALAASSIPASAQGEDIHHPPAAFAAKVTARLDRLGGFYPADPTWSELQQTIGQLARGWFDPESGHPWTVPDLLFAASAEHAWLTDGPGQGELQRTQMAQVLDAMVWRRAYASSGSNIPFQYTEGRGATTPNGPPMCATDAQGFWKPSPGLINQWNALYATARTTPAPWSPGLGIGSRSEWGYSPSSSTNNIYDRIARSFLVATLGLGGSGGPLLGVPVDRARVVVNRMFRVGPLQKLKLDGAASDPNWHATVADFLTGGTAMGVATPFEVEPPVPPNDSGFYRALVDFDPALILSPGRAPDDPELIQALRLRFSGEEPPPGFPTSGGPTRSDCAGHASWSVNEVNIVYREALPRLENTAVTDGTISGRIVDVDGIGIAGATVLAEGPAGKEAGATTDSGGGYRLTSLPGGTYEVSVLLPGNQPTGGALERTACAPNANLTVALRLCRFDLPAGGAGTADFVYLTNDLVTENVEITQGVQDQVWGTPGTFTVGSAGTVPGAAYTGVPLAEGVPTVVRVYIGRGAHRFSGRLRAAAVQLRGYRPGSNGQLTELPSSPLRRPVDRITRGAFLLPVPTLPAMRLRASEDGIYTFELPAQWTSAGAITLLAEANPPDVTGRRDITECVGCERDSSFALTNIPIRAMRSIRIMPVQIDYDFPGARKLTGTDHATDFDRIREVIPLAPKQLTLDRYPVAVVDISSTVAQLVETHNLSQPDLIDCITEATPRCRDDFGSAAIAAVTRAARPRGNGEYAMGYMYAGRSWANSSAASAAMGQHDPARPLTATAHELFHMLGFHHASAACGGNVNTFDEWPPDQTGLIQGVGLDRATAPAESRAPYRVVADGLDQAHYFDFMSYCAGETDAWISPTSWRKFVTVNAAHGSSAKRVAPAATSSGGLGVDASVREDGSVAILGVQGDTGAMTKSESGGPYTIVVQGSGGRTLSRTSVAATEVSESGGSLISVTVPGKGATGAQILARGKVVAKRVAPKRSPKVSLLSPRRGTLKRAKTVSLRWRVRGVRRGTFTTRIEFSQDGGRRWRTLASGLLATRASFKGTMLTTTKRGRLRVIVNDGFNDVTATSGRLRVTK